MRTRPHLFAIVIAALAVCAPGARAAIPDAVAGGEWCEVRTAEVRVLTDAGLARADRIAERIERLHERVRRTLPSLAAGDAACTVLLFRSPATFREYLPRWQGQPEDDTGLYQPGSGGGWLLLPDGSDRELDSATLHEATHALVRVALPRPPVWLDEGLAQYFSTLRVDDADGRVGDPLPECLAWLRANAPMRVADVLALDATAADYHAGGRRLAFYATSWLLVHLLLTESVADQQRFDGYLGALRRGEAPASAFTAAFGDPAALDRRLALYLQRRSLGAMAWSLASPYARMPAERRARVDAAERLAEFAAMLRWRPGDGPAFAREHAEAALSRDPAQSGARAVLAALDAVVRAPVADGRSDFAREQLAIGAFNTGVDAHRVGDAVRAVGHFRLALELTQRPDLQARAREAIALLRSTGEYAELATVHELLAAGRRAAARQRVADLLGGPLSDTGRRSLERLAAALDAAR